MPNDKTKTRCDGLVCFLRPVAGGLNRTGRIPLSDHLAYSLEVFRPAAGRQESVIADMAAAVLEHVCEKAVNELDGRHGHGL